MRIPNSVLTVVRGPLLAAAVAGCSSSGPADPPQPQPIAPTPVTETPSDPVAYDPQAETARLARVDRVLADADEARGERIDEEEQAQAQRQVRSLGGYGGIGIARPPDAVLAACGRG